MRQYFFDVRVGSTFTGDEDGAEFPDLAAAEDEARRAVLEIAKYRLLSGHDEMSVEVRGCGSDPVLIVTVSVAVKRE